MVNLKDRSQDKTPEERRLFYQANKKEMIADLRVMASADFLVKWPVSSKTISHLKSDPLWLDTARTAAASQKPSTDRTPPLPPFSAKWSEAVQLKWLEVWSARR